MNISKLQAAVAAVNNEVTIAAANINFDFTLVKYEAPEEFQPLGEALSSYRRNDAETGKSHVTARRLGALFEGVCPATPNLFKAYGTRVSEISKAANTGSPKCYANSIFAAYSGIDASLHVHLLACILARSWEPPEATAAWVELVKEQQKDINTRLENGEALPFGLAAAAKQLEIPRTQLADWDASARAWLRTADSIKLRQQTQLKLIPSNITLPINQQQSVFTSVIAAWTTALQTMEKLISGMPQAAQDGASLLGLSAWHLYPDMAVLGPNPIDLQMHDPLVSRGGVLTLGLCASSGHNRLGVYWSLSLAHLRHYGHPVAVESELRGDQDRISMAQLMQCLLGAISGYWKLTKEETGPALEFTVRLYEAVKRGHQKAYDQKRVPWDSAPMRRFLSIGKMIADAASTLLDSHGEETQTARKLFDLGTRRRDKFLGQEKADDRKLWINDMPFFGLKCWSRLIKALASDEARIRLLRYVCSEMLAVPADQAIIRFYPEENGTRPSEADLMYSATISACFATAMPLSYKGSKRKRGSDSLQPDFRHCRWVKKETPSTTEEEYVKIGTWGNFDHGPFVSGRFICHSKDIEIVTPVPGIDAFSCIIGDPTIAAIFVSKSHLAERAPRTLSEVTTELLKWCLDSDLISWEYLVRLICSKESALFRILYAMWGATITKRTLGLTYRSSTMEKPDHVLREHLRPPQ
ncbi:hypothetical protein AOQ84DRAFT_224383 [Glonium stellatum]|uniref:Uncharacterized protein n=1 Tax=Glonium stellatum TaxID=574774 RepID=A0A8E2JQJ2_9PEZI|nr:hypothetical protein AOQ84DRAFT_224383 [Glonium stellatum]